MENAGTESQSQSASDKPNPELLPEAQGDKEFESVRLPAFWKNRPKSWFIQLECQFEANGIHSDNARFGIVLRHLDEDTVNIVDSLEQLPESTKYEQIKMLLIGKCLESLEKQLTTLLGDIELGDKAPSALLCELRTLVPFEVEDDVLRKLWLQKLQKRTQELLVLLQDDITLDKLAAFADMVMSTVVASESMSSMYANTITKLTEEVQNLTNLVDRSVVAKETTSCESEKTIKNLKDQVEMLKCEAERTRLANKSSSNEHIETILNLNAEVESLEKRMKETMETMERSDNMHNMRIRVLEAQLEEKNGLIERQMNIYESETRKDIDSIMMLKREVNELHCRLAKSRDGSCNTTAELTQQLNRLRGAFARNKTDKHFRRVHVDIIGPLCDDCQDSGAYKFCLTMVDHVTRWPEVTPLVDATAESVARAFVTTWVSRFGCPTVITTSQATQFKAKSFEKLAKLLGCQTLVPLEPDDTLIEWHYTFKRILVSNLDNNKWLTVLPILLLGLRAAYRPEFQRSVAAKLYLKNLKLPKEFFEDSCEPKEPNTFVEDLRVIMTGIGPRLIDDDTSTSPFVCEKLEEATQVFVRDNPINDWQSLPPYSGPYKVLTRSGKKMYKVSVNGKPHDYPAHRLQAAFIYITDEDSD